MMIEMPSLEWYLERHGDTPDTRMTYYRTFLMQTDYVANKIAESLYLGTPVEEKYRAVLEQRAQARAEIEQLEAMKNEQNPTD